MKLKYFADSNCYEGYDKKNNRYHVVQGYTEGEEVEEEFDLAGDEDDFGFSISFDKETGVITYFLSGAEMYNDGESVEKVRFSVYTLYRYTALLRI